jgi:hypothetical protein
MRVAASRGDRRTKTQPVFSEVVRSSRSGHTACLTGRPLGEARPRSLIGQALVGMRRPLPSRFEFLGGDFLDGHVVAVGIEVQLGACERVQGSDLLLVEVVVDEHTVLGDANIDFAHHRAYFARDLRIAPVRDTTDPTTYSTLRAGHRVRANPAEASWIAS